MLLHQLLALGRVLGPGHLFQLTLHALGVGLHFLDRLIGDGRGRAGFLIGMVSVICEYGLHGKDGQHQGGNECMACHG